MNSKHDLRSQVDEKVLERIAKLMGLATHNSNENEAMQAMDAAMKLLAKHELSASILDILSEGYEPIEDETIAVDAKSRKRWQTILLSEIADAHFCYMYSHTTYSFIQKRRSSIKQYVLVGKNTNRAAVNMLYSYLVGVIQFETVKALKAYRGWEARKTYAHSFRMGMVQRICDRIKEQKEKIIEDELRESGAIVRADPYKAAKEENQRYVRGKGVRLINVAARDSVGSGAGWNRGKETGDKVPLHTHKALEAK